MSLSLEDLNYIVSILNYNLENLPEEAIAYTYDCDRDKVVDLYGFVYDSDGNLSSMEYNEFGNFSESIKELWNLMIKYGGK